MSNLPAPTTSRPQPAAEHPGIFIAFEGGDGAGKSTQANLLADALTKLGRSALLTREPGGTPVGEKLRAMVLEHGQGEIDARTEALLFAAARAAHAAQLIRPALAAGKIVITDRYIDSSVAYQGAGRNLGEAAVREVNEWATDGLVPALTVLLDVAAHEGRSRRGGAEPDRLEAEPDGFHDRIRQAFLNLAAKRPEHYLVLNARLGVDELHQEILHRVKELL